MSLHTPQRSIRIVTSNRRELIVKETSQKGIFTVSVTPKDPEHESMLNFEKAWIFQGLHSSTRIQSLSEIDTGMFLSIEGASNSSITGYETSRINFIKPALL